MVIGLQFTLDDVDSMLVRVLQEGDTEWEDVVWDAACEWVLNNEDAWGKWVINNPYDTPEFLIALGCLFAVFLLVSCVWLLYPALIWTKGFSPWEGRGEAPL